MRYTYTYYYTYFDARIITLLNKTLCLYNLAINEKIIAGIYSIRRKCTLCNKLIFLSHNFPSIEILFYPIRLFLSSHADHRRSINYPFKVLSWDCSSFVLSYCWRQVQTNGFKDAASSSSRESCHLGRLSSHETHWTEWRKKKPSNCTLARS